MKRFYSAPIPPETARLILALASRPGALLRDIPAELVRRGHPEVDIDDVARLFLAWRKPVGRKPSRTRSRVEPDRARVPDDPDEDTIRARAEAIRRGWDDERFRYGTTA